MDAAPARQGSEPAVVGLATAGHARRRRLGARPRGGHRPLPLEQPHVGAVARVAAPHARVVPAPAVLEHAVVGELAPAGGPHHEGPHGAPRVEEALVAADDLALQRGRRHVLRQEDDVLGVVEVPVPGDDPAGCVEVRELLGAGQRREDVEHHRVDVVLEREVHRVAHHVLGVAVGAEHEHAVAADAVVVQDVDRLLDVVDGLRLLEAVERGLVHRLEAEGDEVSPRGPHELEQLVVAHDVGAHLRAPGHGDALVDHQPQELLEALLVGGEVVVVEEDLLRLLLLDLGDHALGAAEAVLAPEHRRHRAEVAGKGAAPAGHDRRVLDALVADDEREVGERQRVEVGAALVQRVVHGLAVLLERETGDALELALALEGLHELDHDRLAALAAGHVVGVLERLVGHEGHVRAADDHRDAPPPQLVGASRTPR